jgi:hypothetical protein
LSHSRSEKFLFCSINLHSISTISSTTDLHQNTPFFDLGATNEINSNRSESLSIYFYFYLNICRPRFSRRLAAFSPIANFVHTIPCIPISRILLFREPDGSPNVIPVFKSTTPPRLVWVNTAKVFLTRVLPPALKPRTKCGTSFNARPVIFPSAVPV